ncbi:MAG: hypothetical protein LBM95_02485 [Lactobacillales bacterium]|jgi:hypothetical protein|nr:hypothetical protein [Lactobacillales bacterium]
MIQGTYVNFSWEDEMYTGWIEKEYTHSYLIEVEHPSEKMKERFYNRMIVSKANCKNVRKEKAEIAD